MAKERPYALMAIQTQILYDIASMLEEQHKTIAELYQTYRLTIPEGKFIPLTVPVTDIPTELSPKNTPTMPWIIFTIFNDGVNGVYIRVNEDLIQTHTPLNPAENITIGFAQPKINKVTLVCLPTLTSSVRIFALK
jgi:hypothetical protein